MLLQMTEFNSFPLCVCVCVCVCVYVYVCVYIHMYTHTHIHTHHIFFIHSSVDGHLDCFHILAVVHNAAMKIGVYVSFQISVFVYSGYVPKE